MITPQQTVAALLATTVWADGDYTEIERFMAAEIARSFRLPAAEFDRHVTDAIAELDRLGESAATAYLHGHASKVHPDDAAPIFMAMIQMVLADGVLTHGEVNNLFALGDALGIDQPTTALMLCDLAKADTGLEVTYERI